MMLNRNPYRIIVLPLLIFLLISLDSCNSEKNLGKQLNKLKLNYTIDSEGDFRVKISLPGNGDVEVGIRNSAELPENPVRIREIWSVAARIPGELPRGLAENLLKDSWSTGHMGGWALAGTTSEGKKVLVYLNRIPESASKELLYQALQDAARSATGLHNALKVLEGD